MSQSKHWLTIGAMLLSWACSPAVVAQDEGDEDAAVVLEDQEPESELMSIPSPDAREIDREIDQNRFLLGRWGTVRDDLAAAGLSFDIQWTQSFMSVADGGADTGFSYGGSLDYLIDLDLAKLGGPQGGFVRVLAESRYGDTVNTDAGTLLPVDTNAGFPLTTPPDDDIAITVTQLTYTQFLSKQFAVLAGKYQTLDGDANEFASGRGRSQFMNANFIFNPVGLLIVPYSTLGVGAVILPSDKVTITATLSNTTDSSTTTGFDDIGEGWTAAVETQFQYRLGRLPGGQVVTFAYAGDGEYTNFSRVSSLPGGALLGTEDDSWLLAWSAWQYIYTPDEIPDRIDTGDGRPDLRGVGLFARAGIADEDTNPIDWSLSIGLGGRGLFPGRDDDTFGVGFAYVDFDDSLVLSTVGFDDEAYGVEAFYRFDFGHGLSLTADVQVLEPFAKTADTTTIVGARVNIRF